MNCKHHLRLLALGSLVLAIAGCGASIVGAAAGAGAVAYVRGELKATEEATLDEVVAAANAALEEDLKFTITDAKADAVSGRVTAKTAADKTVEVNVKKVSDTLTQVRIRVDVFGDEELSRLILDKIKARLQEAALHH